MGFIVFVLVFLFGAIVGSFCNVVLLRKNTGETVVWGKSRCLLCGKELLWHDNIPIISFLFLRGRCRFCKSRISLQYPLVEILAGLIAFAAWTKVFWIGGIPHYGFSIFNPPAGRASFQFLFFFLVFISLFLLAAYDARTKIVDRHLLRAFAILTLGVALARWTGAESGAFGVLTKDIIAAGGIWFFFWAFWFFPQGHWMGRGDSSVALWCALLLGFPLSIAMLLMSYWIGGLVGLNILAVAYARSVVLRNGGLGIQDDVRPLSAALKWEIPFVPFLALGTFTVWFFSELILSLMAAFFMVQ